MPDIVLTTLNAKWIHAAFGLRYLRANLGELRERSAIVEFTIGQRPVDVAEQLLALQPRIVGLGVYVWNAAPALELVRILKQVRSDVVVVLGGPEVSHETERQPIVAAADHVICGEADLAFAALARRLLAGEHVGERVLTAELPHFPQLAWPYDEYDERDIAHRIVYVEASRGCPFTCEFCLSALDVPVRQAEVTGFLAQMQRLLDRGVRHFKFVDRTFNLNLAVSTAILQFFRQRLCAGLFLHFEMIPDRLPEGLRAEIAAFPDGVVQFEVGVQSFDPAVNQRIARRQDESRLQDNLRWLRAHTGVHVHADLIVGLPGEDVATFGRGFDQLWALRPHEIQVGILKRLRGAPIVRHDVEHGMVWSDEPPYEILQTAVVPFAAMQDMKRFARYWDMVANQGNWNATLSLLLAGESAFSAFLALARWLHERTQATSGIALHRLAALLFEWLTGPCRQTPEVVGTAMAADYARCARHDWPEFLRPWVQGPGRHRTPPAATTGAARQARHRGGD